MTRSLLVLLALALVPSLAFAQQLPPPRNPAGDESAPADDLILRRPVQQQGPVIVPPQNAAQQQQQPVQNAAPQPQPPPLPPQAAQAAKKNPDPLHDLIMARHKAEKDRQQANADRANQFRAARAAEDQKLCQDWHQRYLADTPVRVEYYRALAAYYHSQPAIATYTPYYYFPNPPVIVPTVYTPAVYAPVVYAPAVGPVYPTITYGIVTSWRW